MRGQVGKWTASAAVEKTESIKDEAQGNGWELLGDTTGAARSWFSNLQVVVVFDSRGAASIGDSAQGRMKKKREEVCQGCRTDKAREWTYWESVEQHNLTLNVLWQMEPPRISFQCRSTHDLSTHVNLSTWYARTNQISAFTWLSMGVRVLCNTFSVRAPLHLPTGSIHFVFQER